MSGRRHDHRRGVSCNDKLVRQSNRTAEQMSSFRYRAVTPAGEFVSGEVDAPSRQEVVKRIEYLGHLAIEVEAAKTSSLARSSAFRGRTPQRRDVTIFLRQLAVLVGAGLTLEAALQALGDDTSKALAWLRRNVDIPARTWSAVGL